MHFVDLLLSEVAVAGLEGATLNQLWQNLRDSRVGFPWKIDENSKQFIWSTLLKMNNINYYVLPCCLAPQKEFSRIDCLVEMKDGTYYKLPESYPPIQFFPVNKNNHLGSSKFYDKRRDITDVIHNDLSFSVLENVVEKWGDTLVLVASQRERNRFLFGSPSIPPNFSASLYVTLEAIAKYTKLCGICSGLKHKYNGLPTTHQDGLLSSGMANGTIWYMRHKLEKMGVIKSQPYLAKVGKKPVMPGLLLHHRKYYLHFPFPPAMFMDRISQFLLNKPGNKCFGFEIRKLIGLTSKGIRRTLGFGVRHGWLDVVNTSFRDACATLLNKSEDDVDDDDMLSILQKTNCPVDPHHRYPCMVNLVSLKKRFSMDSWISECGQGENAFGFKKCKKEEYDIDSDDALDEEYEAVDCQMELSAIKLDNSGINTNELNLERQQSIPIVYDTQMSMNTSFLPSSITPSLNIDESIAIQIVRILVLHEYTMADLLAITKTSLYNLRRTLKSLVTVGVLKAVKRSMDSTFVLYYSLFTDSDREEAQKVKLTKSTPELQTLPTIQTQRQNRRLFVLNYLSKYRIIASEYSLRQLIWDHERSIGLKIRMDRKSLRRILDELIQAKLAIVIKTKSLKGDVTFICQPDVKEDDPLILTAIKNIDLAALRNLPVQDGKSSSVIFSADQVSIIEGVDHLSSEAMTIVLHKIPALPKMRRRALIHEYLFYVIYDLPNTLHPVKPQTKGQPPVYLDDDTWRRYVAPLEPIKGMTRGWFLISEVLRGIPFGLYLRLTITTSLPRILCRWLKLDYLLTSLTQEERDHIDLELTRFRNSNMSSQKDIPIRDLLRYPLRYVELPGGSRGPLNDWLLSAKKLRSLSAMIEDISASLLDTRSAMPSYQVLTKLARTNVLRFDFQSSADVASYWLTSERIALCTPLGHISCKDEIDPEHVPPIEAKVSLEPVDDGSLLLAKWPEDILSKFRTILTDGTEVVPCGACGYHPADFTYNVRNWGAVRDIKSKHKGDTDGIFNILDELTTFEEACGFVTPSDEVFWYWLPSLFADLNVPNILQAVDAPQTAGKQPTNRRSLRNNRLHFSEKDFYKNGLQESDRSSRNNQQRIEVRDTDSIFKEICQQNALDASENFRPIDQHLSKSLSSSENKENVINGFPSQISSDLTPCQRVVVRRIRGILKQCKNDLYLRAPRCSWTKLEDRLLITCRVASVLIAGETRREYITTPYTFVRDVLHRYIPQLHCLKTSVTCARRLKNLLLNKGPEWISGKLLFSRVSSRPDWQLKYNFGRDKWRTMCKEETEKARLIFLELVHNIVSTFMPHVFIRLNSLNAVKRGNHASTNIDKLTDGRVDTFVSIGSSRYEMESCYESIHLCDPNDQNVVPEVGTDRILIVLYTMYNYILASFRFSSDPSYSSAFNESLFHWIIRHYPKPQVNHAIALLMKNHIIKRPKSFSRWTHGEFYTQVKYIPEAHSIWTSSVNQLNLPKSDKGDNIVSDRNVINNKSRKKTRPRIQKRKEVEVNKSELPKSIHKHLFAEITTGGCVAFFLEQLLFYPFVDIKISIRVEDIVLVGSNQACTEDTLDSLSLQTVKQTSAVQLKPTELRKDLLYRMGVSNEVLNDPLFIGDYNFMRHSRWFDHHLSFTGGYIQAILTDNKSENTSWSLPKLSRSLLSSLKPIVQKMSNSLVFQMPDFVVNSLNGNPVDGKSNVNVDLDMKVEDSLTYRLEDYIRTGRFTGRSVIEIKENFGDRSNVSNALKNLLDSQVVFNVGSVHSRFVHHKHIRLWLIHLKPNMNLRNSTQLSKDGKLEPIAHQPKRFRLDTTVPSVIESQTGSIHSLKDPPNMNDIPSGYFFPQPWFSEIGSPKPRLFCDVLQSLCAQLSNCGGTTLALFAQQHQTLFGQQTIRQLLCHLQDMGAIRMIRVVANSQPCLFSDRVTYTISDDILLASPEELTLIPEPNYVTIIGTFTDMYLRQNKSNSNNTNGAIINDDATTNSNNDFNKCNLHTFILSNSFHTFIFIFVVVFTT
ncbi:general transcription factor 3C polypeptide 1 [Schistosoma japonicum]|nr:general transcription factor 3C polypeptide 1 [Schistosoma japonicum]